MTALFARLKLRLLLNGIGSDRQRSLLFFAACGFGLFMAMAGFVSLLSARFDPARGDNVVVVLFSGLFAGWAIVPLLGFGVDETLDVTRLSLLPIPRRRLVRGLFVASLIGIAPVCTALAISGAIPGFATTAWATVVTVAAIALELTLCVLVSRAMTTLLSSLLRSRRGKDLSTVLLVLIAVTIAVSMQFAREPLLAISELRDSPLIDAMAWTPPGALGTAIAAARDGAVKMPIAALATAALTSLGLVLVWAVALGHMAVRADAGTEGTRAGSKGLFPLGLTWLPRNRVGAVAAKEARYLWRDPRQRANLLILVVFGLAFALFPAVAGGIENPDAVLFAAGTVWLLGIQGLNQFGYDGPAIWANVVAGGDPAHDLVGKNIVYAVFGLGIVLTAAVILAALTGAWELAPVAVLIAAGALGVAFAVGNVVSVLAPFPVGGLGDNAYGTKNSGQGCAIAFMSGAAVLCIGVLWLPIASIVMAGQTWWRPALGLAGLFAPLYGGLVWWAGWRLSSELVRRRLPEIVAALDLSAHG
ncbi:MAG: hypothetical protein IT198_09740 [Acidimicrobiia bacterium]|nr:hypothetical protein [Acidimicrobiia bacterium]